MTANLIKDFLDSKDIRYVLVEHSVAYTPREIAERTQIKTEQFAKTVMITMDGSIAMVVLPASCRIRWDRFMNAMGTDFIALADEEEFEHLFTDCEVGAMPPFGNLFDIPVYLYEGFNQNEEIAFRAGNHREIIKMNLQDYIDLAKPMTVTEGFARIGVPKPAWLSKRKSA